MDAQNSATGLRVSRREFNAAFSAAMAAAAVATVTPDGQASVLGQHAAPWDRMSQCTARAVAYLETIGQAPDGSFSAQAGVGVTALAAAALLQNGRGVGDPAVAKSLAYLEKFVHPDGGIYTTGGAYDNYETCLAIMCLKTAEEKSGASNRFRKMLHDAERFVRSYQWNESTGRSPSDLAYGGAGYGKHKRPDLSNTAFLVDALNQCGAGSNDPAIQKALVFVSRCQNLESAENTTPFASKNPDGGFFYTCAAGGKSSAGSTATGGLRSYASMTYSGLKSMIYAGLGPDDPRVKAAITWIRRNYDVRSNPGLGDAGLFYYYHTFAKTLNTLGVERLDDGQGVSHDWRTELVDELAAKQAKNGSWVNDNARWMEGDPNLVTSYALLAISHCV